MPQELGLPEASYLRAPDPGARKAFVMGAAQGVSFGFADELKAAIKALMAQGKPFKEAYGEAIVPIRARYATAERTHPIAFEGGLAAGAVAPSLAAPGSLIGRATMGGLAVQGALYGAGSSEADLMSPEPKDIREAAKDVLAGVGTGIVVNKALPHFKEANIDLIGKGIRKGTRLAKKALPDISFEAAESPVIRKMIEKGGQWAETLAKGLAHGNVDLAATVFVLQQIDPSFQKDYKEAELDLP